MLTGLALFYAPREVIVHRLEEGRAKLFCGASLEGDTIPLKIRDAAEEGSRFIIVDDED